MRNRSFGLFVALGVLLTGFLLSGCSRDNFSEEATPRDGMIHFRLASSTALDVATRSNGLDTITLENSGSKTALSLSRTVAPTNVATKGAPVTGFNIDERYADELFVTAFKMSDKSEYIPQQKLLFVSREEGHSESIWETATCYTWAKTPLAFCSWAPKTAASFTSYDFDNNKAIFRYETPTPDGSSTDAEIQPDFIVASTVSDGTSGNSVTLLHEHALSAIKFEMGNTNACKVVDISLKGVFANGTCTYSPNATGPDPKIVWSSLDTPTDYLQTFGTSITEKFDGDNNPQAIEKASAESGVATFMIIPQSSTASNKITLTVRLKIDGAEDPVSLIKVLSEEETQWKPGMTYTYTISTSDAGEISVSVTDNVSEGKKTNVVISNNGAVREYIRAAIVGNWFKDGGIVAPWTYDAANPSASKFVDLPSDASGSGARWIYNSADGFYYYTAPVAAGSATGTKLFTSFTAPSTTPPVTGACFEMKLMVQGVIYDLGKTRVTTAWGADVAALLSTDN